jgi:signal transduction histidine kinase
MKLLKKTNRAYFIISASAFLVAGVAIYFFISLFFDEQVNEKLLSDRMTVIKNIEKDGSLPDFYPFVEVKIISDRNDSRITSCDTLIFDLNEKENIPFRQIRSVAVIKGKTYSIVLRETLLERSDMLMTIGFAIVVVFLLLNISLYFINKKLSLKIWEPFYTTLNDLRGFSHDSTEFKLSAVSEIDEFTELNKTLETLALKVISDYQSLKRFTEDASHEIQTPIAVIQSKLETMMQDPDLKKNQAELLKSAYTSLQRISKLTQTLTFLTKIANDQFPEKGEVNFSLVLLEAVKLFEDLITGKSLNLKSEVDPDFILKTNPFLAESMVINLVGNSAKHCTTGGMIIIRLDKGLLEISNSGFPISGPSSKLFERFYKVNASSESQGLGLAIVKEICSHNKWEINYLYENSLHRFTVRF